MNELLGDWLVGSVHSMKSEIKYHFSVRTNSLNYFYYRTIEFLLVSPCTVNATFDENMFMFLVGDFSPRRRCVAVAGVICFFTISKSFNWVNYCIVN